MLLSSALFLLGSLALQCMPGRAQDAEDCPVDQFIEKEWPIALEQIYCNFGSDGCQAQGVGDGLMIASPSRENPDYWYTWTRDNGLVVKLLSELLDNPDVPQARLQNVLSRFVTSQARIQGVSNPSGDLSNGAGLGEPKFNVDFSAFTGDWGRPQHDGPALRVLGLVPFANWLIKGGCDRQVVDYVWLVIRNDLEYIVQYWNSTGFDLWEENRGSSFFTTAVQHKALAIGAKLGGDLGQRFDHYLRIAPQVLCFLQSYWLPNQRFILANINANQQRNGRDANTILGSIHTFDPEIGCDSNTFQPCSDRALANHKEVVDSFRNIYPINSGIPRNRAVAIGRYNEDVYAGADFSGGNPWFMTTMATAEQLYDALYVWEHEGCIIVTETSLAFFRDHVPDITPGYYSYDTATFQRIMGTVMDYADGFMDIIANYTANNGSMSEQYSRVNGSQTSARDLTWSYGAFLSSVLRRHGKAARPWAAFDRSTEVPSSCVATTERGSFATVTGTMPACTVVPSSTTTTCPSATAVAVTFQVRAAAGQEILVVVGNQPQINNWSPGDAPPMTRSSEDRDLWSRTVTFMPGLAVEYKYVRRWPNGGIQWERDPNHQLSVPATCQTAITVTDDFHQP